MPRLRWVILILAAVSLGCQHQRDTVNNALGGTQNETHIAVWGDVMVVGWNDITDAGYRTAYTSSTNGGQTWADARPLVSLGVRTDGDPAIAVDNAGTFYFATMVEHSDGDRSIGVYRSTQLSPEVRFGEPVFVNRSPLTALQDRPWIAVDYSTTGETTGNVYLCWTDIGDGNLKFVRSKPTNPLVFNDLSIIHPTTPGQDPGTACNIGVGPFGEVYVTWIAGVGTNGQKIYVRRSKSGDGGVNFGPAAEVAAPAPSGDWNGPNAPSASRDCSIDRPNMRALGGHIRLADAPVIAVDRSGRSRNGTVYIAYSADPDGPGPDVADVFVVRLTPKPVFPGGNGDPGFTWSEPIAIHKTAATQEADGADQTSNDNWMPAIAVSSSGTVAVSFYDRRNDPTANMKIDLYAAISRDGGASWTNQRVTSASFGVPRLLDDNEDNFQSLAPPCYMGDYNGVAAAGTHFHLVWGDNSKVVVSLPHFPDGRPDPDIKYERLDGP